MTWRGGRRWVALFVLVLIAILLWPVVKAHLQALAVLKGLSHEPLPLPARAVTVRSITTSELTIPMEGGQSLRARLYTPAGATHAPGMVIVHGVHHLGMDEPRLELFATAMASCGLRVLTPELPAIKDYRIGPESIAAIGESAQWLSQQTGAPVVLLGLSFSGGLSLLAAERPQFAPSIRFVFAVGSQSSMARVAAYYRTGKAPRPDATVQVLPPHEYGPLVMEYEHLEDFLPAADIPAVSLVLKEHLYEDTAAEQKALTTLNPTQKLEALELMQPASAKTQALLERNELAHVSDMAAVSPEAQLGSIATPVYLLHGEADNVIPSAETLWLAHGLRPDALRAVLVSPLISHVEMGKVPGITDEWNLLHFMAGVMRDAER